MNTQFCANLEQFVIWEISVFVFFSLFYSGVFYLAAFDAKHGWYSRKQI